MSAIESGLQAERDTKFQDFVEQLVEEDFALFDLVEEEYRRFAWRVDNDLYTPLYEMNKNYCWPRRRHLEQGVAPLAGLPEWGYSMFKVHAPWETPPEDGSPEGSFKYRGVDLSFECVENDLPVPGREITECDSPSEFDYEFDESGWATGNEPDWS